MNRGMKSHSGTKSDYLMDRGMKIRIELSTEISILSLCCPTTQETDVSGIAVEALLSERRIYT